MIVSNSHLTKIKQINGKGYTRWREYNNHTAAERHLKEAKEKFFDAEIVVYNDKYVVYVLRKK